MQHYSTLTIFNKSTNTLIKFICAFFICISCSNPDNVVEGLKVVHYPGSDAIKQTIEYKNGKKNGYFKEFFRNGKLKAKQFYVNDTLNDSSLVYLPDGRFQSIHVYKNKRKYGCWKEFNNDGLLFSETLFKDGKLHGTSTRYSYRTRKLLTSITYNNGQKEGAEEHYYPSGKPQSKEYFVKGELCKGTEEWFENGTKVNNDFKISISENDAVLLKNALTYIIRLENSKPTDKVYQVIIPGQGKEVGLITPLKKKDDVFIYEYTVPKGGFVMEKVTIAAFRQTQFGNTFIKTQSFNVASNNF